MKSTIRKKAFSLVALTLLLSSASSVLANNFEENIYPQFRPNYGQGQNMNRYGSQKQNNNFNALSQEEREERRAEQEERRAAREEKKAEMDRIFDENDYGAWEELMTEKITERISALQEKITELEEKKSKINEETFAKVSEAHELRENGDKEGAKEIMEELGFGKLEGRGGKKGGHRGMRGGGMKGGFNQNQ